MEITWDISTVTLLAAAVIIISKLTTDYLRPKRKSPPGPKPWPIIGNLNLLGNTPHQALHQLSRTYGTIMQLKFGSFPVVIASSPEMAKQFLKTYDHVFCSRPATAAGKYTSYNYSDMTWAPYGPYWRQARRIYVNEIFNARRLGSSEYIRVEERRAFISRLFAASGKPVVLKEHLSHYTLSSISRMVMGNKYFTQSESDSGDQGSIITFKEFHAMMDEWFLLNGVFNTGDWIPWLSFLDFQGYVKRMKALYKKWDRFHNHVISDHKSRRQQSEESFDKDMVDVLLQHAEDPNLEIRLTSDCVKGLMQDLLNGGTDTSATTVEWAIHEVLRQPRIIEKARKELDRVIGREKWVEEEDLSKLPYIDAIIKESLRLHPLATLLAPHFSIEDCEVSGYHIPRGTTILINTWSIGRDPNSWDEPEEFRPERFLLEKSDIDLAGRSFELLPFGSGRRKCPGYSLGTKMIRSTLANLLHGFDIKLPGDMKPEDICMEELYGLTTHPKVPLALVMDPRLPLHLY
uniref:Cytochrome P450 n=1 Tax=Nothapodytes nimmoniana TaxID=159386 RepID=A0A7L7RB43_NOTNI|nr:cytochrome P450 [Nothapodytes nimmoniana]